MTAFPAVLKLEIKRLHPELMDADLREYICLIYEHVSLDEERSPEKVKQIERQIADLVERCLPNLSEAYAAYENAMKGQREEELARDLPDPVEVALADKNVIRWLAVLPANVGPYAATVRLIKKPLLYEVTFGFKNGFEMVVSVERQQREVAFVFRRMKK